MLQPKSTGLGNAGCKMREQQIGDGFIIHPMGQNGSISVRGHSGLTPALKRHTADHTERQMLPIKKFLQLESRFDGGWGAHDVS